MGTEEGEKPLGEEEKRCLDVDCVDVCNTGEIRGLCTVGASN